MLIDNEFTVAQPVEKVWEFFGNIPQVALCLPGAELTEDLGDGAYQGKVGISMGPVKMAFDGAAKILQRDDASKTMVIDGAGADQKGRGNAKLLLTAHIAASKREVRRITLHKLQALRMSQRKTVRAPRRLAAK